MRYDGNGRRLIRQYHQTPTSSVKRFEYTFNNLDPIAIYDIQAKKHENLYRGADNNIIQSQYISNNSNSSGTRTFYHYDALGSVVGRTNSSGSSDKTYRYESFGSDYSNNPSTTGSIYNLGFTGEEFNEQAGVYEFYSRSYDPTTGTWLQRDKYRGELNVPQSLHSYAYVMNGPVNTSDLYGYLGDCWDIDAVCNTQYIKDHGLQESWNDASQQREERIEEISRKSDQFIDSASLQVDRGIGYATADLELMYSFIDIQNNPAVANIFSTPINSPEFDSNPYNQLKGSYEILGQEYQNDQNKWTCVSNQYGAGEMALSIAFDGYDNLNTGNEVLQGRGSWFDALALLPIIPGSTDNFVKKVIKGAPEGKVDDVGDIAKKSVNLPSVNKIKIDMGHVSSGHMVGGSRVSDLKTTFPKYMTENNVKSTIKIAYSNAKKVETQGERIKLRGKSGGIEVEMWINTSNNTIETAYPIY